MSGIAIVVKDISFASSNLGQVTFADQVIPITALSISNNANVPLNASTITLSVAYTPANTTQKGVTWSVTSGGTYATVNQNGVVTLRNLVANAQFTIKAQSTADANINSTKTFTVVSSNMITEVKNGYKVNTATGEFEANSDYICTNWIDVDNVAIAVLNLTCTVAEESQQSGAISANNVKIGIAFQDNAGSYHAIEIANNLIATSTFKNEATPLLLPVREMKKISLYSLVASPASQAGQSAQIMRCNLADWQGATLTVSQMKLAGTETYDKETICTVHSYGGSTGQSATANSMFIRYAAVNMLQFMTMIKQGESVSLTTLGGASGRAWFKYAIDGTKIDQAADSADYTETPYTFTADQDMFLVGTTYTSSTFALVITKP